jgi:hypothetical protein
VTVAHRNIEQLDHVNHDPAVCTSKALCICIRSVNPLDLALVTPTQNLFRSNGKAGVFYERDSHCTKGHHRMGMTNCPTCKSDYDAARYANKLSIRLAAV